VGHLVRVIAVSQKWATPGSPHEEKCLSVKPRNGSGLRVFGSPRATCNLQQRLQAKSWALLLYQATTKLDLFPIEFVEKATKRSQSSVLIEFHSKETYSDKIQCFCCFVWNDGFWVVLANAVEICDRVVPESGRIIRIKESRSVVIH
jgi:hypothetical protein